MFTNNLTKPIVDDILDAIEKMRSIPKPPADVALLMRHEYESLRRHVETLNPSVASSETAMFASIYGIPFEVFDRESERANRAIELVESGKRPLIMSQQKDRIEGD
jgi:hypothetical protein